MTPQEIDSEIDRYMAMGEDELLEAIALAMRKQYEADLNKMQQYETSILHEHLARQKHDSK